MFEPRDVLDTSALAWTLFLMLLVAAAAGGFILARSLHRCEAQLAQAQNDLQQERTRTDVQKAVVTVCKRQLATYQGDVDSCKTDLGSAQTRLREVEAAKQRR